MNAVGCDKLGMDLLINWKAGLHGSGKSSGGFRLQFLVCEVQTMKISTLLSGAGLYEGMRVQCHSEVYSVYTQHTTHGYPISNHNK